MVRLLLPIFALILGSASLMLAGGLNGILLPLRGSEEGFSAFSLGLLGTGWAIGYMGGCLAVPRLVHRAGHIRTFAVMAAFASASVLLSVLIVHPSAWIPLRALTGFSFAGAAMIVESWLNERTEDSYRGRVFGVYTMVNLLATTAGQMLVITGNPSGFALFVVAALLYTFSLVPSALTRTEQPQPLVETSLDLRRLIRNSPIAVAGSFLIGVSNSSFGTLGVVFGEAIELDVTSIALMMSLSLLAGSAFQIPVGMISDRFDRRLVLIGLAVFATLVDLFFILFRPESASFVIPAMALFGGAIYAMYPVVVAHAYDHAEPGNYMKISGGLLLMFGAGGIVGPLMAGAIMALYASTGLFLTTFAAHVALAGFAFYRTKRRAAVPEADKTDFVGLPPERLSTPGSAAFDPRVEAGEREITDIQ